jgi:hypothetical protein
MTCSFNAYQISGQNQVVLVHTGSTGPADLGFGLTSAGATLQLHGSTPDPLTLTPIQPWTPEAIVATYPSALPPGMYTIALSVPAPASCTNTAQLVVPAAADILPDLTFTAVIPSTAPVDSDVTIVNTKPGFTFDAMTHALSLFDAMSNRVPITVSRWGANRLSVHVGDSLYTFTNPVHTFRFGSSTYRLPIILTPAVPVPTPGAVARGTFRVLVTGFHVDHETADHILEVDGKGDEIQLRAELVEHRLGASTSTPRTIRSKVFGDVNRYPARIQAGSRSSLGGLRTGDDAGTHARNGQMPTADRLPLVLWEGELEAGGLGVLISPTIWEVDDTIDPTLLEPNWPTGLDGLAETLLAGAVNGIRGRLALPALPQALPAPLPASATINDIGEVVDTTQRNELRITRDKPGWGGRSGDRPVGLVDDPLTSGRQQAFPQLIMLTYETALLMSQTPGMDGDPAGTFRISYADDNDGAYTLFLQVEKL